jgi:medium-chain acyl-[acyl-carrier-protein] hydrolase
MSATPSKPMAKNPWFTCFEKRPRASLRLLCFPHAGGSATAFATWHRDLPETVEVCAVQLPGRDERRTEARRTELAGLVAELVPALRELHDRPVALFGYSLGALVAFEYARALRRSGSPAPRHLFVAARKAPQLPNDPPIHALPDAQFIREANRRYDGIPRVILDEPELLAYFLSIIRDDAKLFESYRYASDEPLACPITALAGTADPMVTRETLEPWATQTEGPFRTALFPGGHFFITQQRRAVFETVRSGL